MIVDSADQNKHDATSGDAALDRSLNRELSWLEFNRRVLHEALDPRTPLLERVGFLSIFTSNLDEFFMKRVGGLKRQLAAGVVTRSRDGLTAAEQIAAIRESVLPMLEQQAECFIREIRPQLREHGVHLLSWAELTDADKDFAREFYRSNIFAVLNPLAVDSGHPFPLLSNLSQSLGVCLRHPDRDERLFARVKIPEVLLQWVRLPSASAPEENRFVSLLEIVRHNLHDLFPGMIVQNVMPFRVTRNADIERDEEDAEDLLDLISEELRARRFANIVRLEHGPDPDPWMLEFLTDELNLTAQDVFELPAELDYTDLKPIIDLPIPQLRVEPWSPVVPAALEDRDADFFALIRRGDLMVHHPYDSFSASVERFIATAADDPKVQAIKMTLYRTGDRSPFVRMLIRAAESGKQVVCMVELKARFDEQRNIRCAQMLENAGVHVVYGLVGYKTHTKTALVVRREAEGLRCYAHIGTGNYHSGTARLYTDLGIFTADPDLTEDIVELFHFLTGRSLKQDYRKLLVAPVNMRSAFLEMIDTEIANHAQGKPARIIAKMNSLQDPQIIDALYGASSAGVPIDLAVRGFCCLRPGVPGLSENITVISIIGRFLEHSRIFHFADGSPDPIDGRFFIGSADWMSRNLDNRVEAIAPVDNRSLREQCWQILQLSFDDQRQAWDMQPDGTYVQRAPSDPATQIGLQAELMAITMNEPRSGGATTSAPSSEPVRRRSVEPPVHGSRFTVQGSSVPSREP